MDSHSPTGAKGNTGSGLENTVLEIPSVMGGSPVASASRDRPSPCQQDKGSAHDRQQASAQALGFSTRCWRLLRDVDEAPASFFLGQAMLGFGQVIFCGSRVTGLCFFGGLFCSDPWLAVLALVGCISGTCTGNAAGFEPSLVQKGLAGYNGVLVGCAFAVFISPEPWTWRPLLATIVGGCFSAFLTVACGAWSDCPVWTFPFNIVALSAFLYAQPLSGAPSPSPAEGSADWSGVLPLDVVGAVLRGLAEIFVAHHWATGFLVAVGSFWHSPRLACSLLLGSALGFACAFAVQANLEQATAGLWGFNPALTTAAVCTFFEHSRRTFSLMVWSAIATGLLAAGLSQSFTTAFKMPAGTLPFCLVATVAWALLGKVVGYQKRAPTGSVKDVLSPSQMSLDAEPAALTVIDPTELKTIMMATAMPSSPLPVGPVAVSVDLDPLSPRLLSPSSLIARRKK